MDAIICKNVVDAVREVIQADAGFEEAMKAKCSASNHLTKELLAIGRGGKEVVVEVDGARFFVDSRRYVIPFPCETIVETAGARDFTKE